jgi:type IV secretion system protein VirB4
LAWLFAPPTGDAVDSNVGQALAIVETERHSPYHWSLHHGDVGHTAIFGSTGSGKSFLVNFMLLQAQQYNPLSFVLDLGGSYTHLVEALGGSVWRFSGQRRASLNPFAHPPSPAHVDVLHQWVRLLVQTGGAYSCSTRDDRDLRESIEAVYLLDRTERRLGSLARTLPRTLGARLFRWVEGGEYGHVFDNVDDAVSVGPCQAFDLQGLEATPVVIEPLLFYIWARIHAAIRSDVSQLGLKLVVCDEAWRFVKDPTAQAALLEGLKTWRKYRAALILATQSDTDLGDESELLTAVLENCPTKLFLANPGLDVARASDRFHLTPREAARIVELRPREQFLLKRPTQSTVLSLHVDSDTARLLGRHSDVSSSKEVRA